MQVRVGGFDRSSTRQSDRGIRFFTTCSSETESFVTKPGADRVIVTKNELRSHSHSKNKWTGCGFEFTDTIGETIQRSLEIIRPFGRLINTL